MIRYKPVPEPREELLRDVYAAVPADPTETDDCCARILETTGVPDRETAREWLVFVRAIGLAGRDDRGFYRLDWIDDRQALGDAFQSRVLGARELVGTIAASGPLTRTELVEALEADDSFPADRPKGGGDPALETRVRRLLGWSVLFELVTEIGGEYEVSPDRDSDRGGKVTPD